MSEYWQPARLELALLDPQVGRGLGFEGVVATNHSSLYRPKVKVKNPHYWRRDAEREAIKGSTRVSRRLDAERDRHAPRRSRRS